MLAHLAGCTWWFLKTSLIDAEQLAQFKAEENVQTPIISSYIVAIYFLMCTLCTVGYGDISPTGDNERIFIIFAMIIGASMFAIVISNMSQILAESANTADTQNEEEKQRIMRLLKRNHCSRSLEERVRSWFYFKTKKAQFQNRLEHVTTELPQHLSDEINLAVLAPVLNKNPVFESLSRACSIKLARYMESTITLPGEMVYKNEQDSNGLLLLLSGNIQLHLPSDGIFIEEQLLFQYKVGQLVGAIFSEGAPGDVLYGPRCGDAWSMGYSELYNLSKATSRQLSDNFPEFDSCVRAEMTRQTKDIEGVMCIEEGRWKVVDLTKPIVRWLYLSCRLYLMDAAKDSRSNPSKSAADIFGSSIFNRKLHNSLRFSVTEAIQLLVEMDRKNRGEETEYSGRQQSESRASGSIVPVVADCNPRVPSAQVAASRLAEWRKEEEKALVAAACVDTSAWFRLAENAKSLHTGMQVALAIARNSKIQNSNNRMHLVSAALGNQQQIPKSPSVPNSPSVKTKPSDLGLFREETPIPISPSALQAKAALQPPLSPKSPKGKASTTDLMAVDHGSSVRRIETVLKGRLSGEFIRSSAEYKRTSAEDKRAPEASPMRGRPTHGATQSGRCFGLMCASESNESGGGLDGATPSSVEEGLLASIAVSDMCYFCMMVRLYDDYRYVRQAAHPMHENWYVCALYTNMHWHNHNH
jgi:hypothetical protein